MTSLRAAPCNIETRFKGNAIFRIRGDKTMTEPTASDIAQQIRTTRIAGGLLLGYNPWKAGARLKTPAFTLFRPYCP